MRMIAVVALAAGISGSAAADEGTRLSLIDTLIVEYHTDNRNGVPDDDDYALFLNRLNLIGSSGPLTGTVRVDAMKFVGAPTDGFKDDIRLERFSLNYAGDRWTLRAGDFFRQLGRGFALSIRKVDEAGLDIAMRGGEAVYETAAHRVSLFGGAVNVANIDAVSELFVEDTNDAVVGLEYLFSGLDFLIAGVHGVGLVPSESLLEGDQDYSGTAGFTFEFPDLTDWLSLYVEANLQYRSQAGEGFTGHAAYMAADFAFEQYLLLAEVLWLDGFEQTGSSNSALQNLFAYNQPPTLERLDQEVLNNRDVVGGRLRAERIFDVVDLVIHANAMLRITDFDTSAELWQIHAFGGFEYRYQGGASRFQVSGGYRTELGDGDLTTPGIEFTEVKSMGHVEFDYTQRVAPGASIHIVSTNEFRSLGAATYERGSTILSADISGIGGVGFEFGYDTQNRSDAVQNYFFAGTISYHILDQLRLRATAGTERGGLKCVAGVCRDYPEFAGARMELVARM